MRLAENTAAHVHARSVFLIATFFAAAALVIEGGLSIFAAGLAVTTLMQWHAERGRARATQPGIMMLMALVLLIICTASLSALVHRLPLSSLDNVVRLLLLPWCAWLAWRTGVSRVGVWYGACVGVVLAVGIACIDIIAGELRAGGGGNPIVFANLTLLLLAIVLFAAPARRWPQWLLIVLALICGSGVILLSGSRTALVVLFGLVGVATLRHASWRARAGGILAMVSLVVAIAAAATWIPVLHEALRLDMIGPNLQYYLAGNPDTPIGARLQLLKLAWDGFLAQPEQGVGIDNFSHLVRDWTGCQQQPVMGMCGLGHAHNDLAEWAVTLGVPGLLAILSLYALPMAMFAAMIRAAGKDRPQRAAWTGAMVVLVHMLCGITQSVFSHAVTASAYALFTGTLLGMAWREFNTDTDG